MSTYNTPTLHTHSLTNRIEESGTLGVPTFLAETSSGIKSKSRGSQRCEAPTTVSTPRSSAVVPSCNAVNTELFKEVVYVQ